MNSEPTNKSLNSDCIACQEKRQHTVKEYKQYHPLAGHGYTPESGWTHPDIAQGRIDESSKRVRAKEKST